MTCKTIASKLAQENRRPVNPLALKLGLVDPVTQYFGILQGDNPAEHYYAHLLSLLERYFDNEIEFTAFEDALRLMFTNEAYLMFNLDKVIGGIVRQVSYTTHFFRVIHRLIQISRFKRLLETSNLKNSLPYFSVTVRVLKHRPRTRLPTECRQRVSWAATRIFTRLNGWAYLHQTKKMDANDECQVTRQGDAYYPAFE